MILKTITTIRRERGNCYISDLVSLGIDHQGNSLGEERPSSLVLFEDASSLGPSGSTHQDIREHGRGRFSHWGSTLYFSTSDNTDPLTNGRTYRVISPKTDHEHIKQANSTAHSMASTSVFFKEVLSTALSTQGSELHSVFTFRLLKMFLEKNARVIENLECLEVGASPTNGLAICLGLAGAKSVTLNNKIKITREINLHFAQNVMLLLSLVQPIKRKLDEVVILDCNERHILNPEIFTFADELDAAHLSTRIPEKIEKMDLIFSVSVLEHIRHLDVVLTELYNFGGRGCISIHGIDARDHTDFNSPIRYLYLSEDDFNNTYDESNNRWRLPDYVEKMDGSKWATGRKTEVEYVKELSNLSGGKTDMYTLAMCGPENIFTKDLTDIKQILSEAEVKNLDLAFHSYSAKSISALVFWMINIKG